MEVTVDYKVSIESDDTAGPDDFANFSESVGFGEYYLRVRLTGTASVMTAARRRY